MMHTLRRHKKLLIIVGLLLASYITAPMVYRTMLPGHIFDFDAEDVTAIELHDEFGRFITVDDPEEIKQLIEQLNSRRYIFWRFDSPVGGDSYGLTIYRGQKTESFHLERNWVQDGIIFYTDMEFVTDYFDE